MLLIKYIGGKVMVKRKVKFTIRTANETSNQVRIHAYGPKSGLGEEVRNDFMPESAIFAFGSKSGKQNKCTNMHFFPEFDLQFAFDLCRKYADKIPANNAKLTVELDVLCNFEPIEVETPVVNEIPVTNEVPAVNEIPVVNSVLSDKHREAFRLCDRVMDVVESILAEADAPQTVVSPVVETKVDASLEEFAKKEEAYNLQIQELQAQISMLSAETNALRGNVVEEEEDVLADVSDSWDDEEDDIFADVDDSWDEEEEDFFEETVEETVEEAVEVDNTEEAVKLEGCALVYDLFIKEGLELANIPVEVFLGHIEPAVDGPLKDEEYALADRVVEVLRMDGQYVDDDTVGVCDSIEKSYRGGVR